MPSRDETRKLLQDIIAAAPNKEAAFEQVRAELLELMQRCALRCVECGKEDDHARGWRIYLDVDDEPQTYCPPCAQAEFGEQ